MRFVVDVYSGPELDRVVKALGVEVLPEQQPFWRSALLEPDRQRARHRKPATVARALILYGLTTKGGGRLTLEQAGNRYQNEWERDLPGGWEKEVWQVIADLGRDYGPV